MITDAKRKLGIDRFVPDSKYQVTGATMIAWGFGKMPMAFVIDEAGIVRHEQQGLKDLESAVRPK